MADARKIHEAQGAGRWFTGKPDRLRAEVAAYVDGANPSPVDGRIVSAIAPHAGYMYSGRVAGYTFRAIRDNARAVGAAETVVVLGFSHSSAFRGVALLETDAIATPLGETPLDTEATGLLVETSRVFRLNSVPHRGEHSAENEVPFVQHVLPSAGIVLALAGDHEPATVDGLVRGLTALSNRKTLVVVASTDMLHDADYDLVTRTDKQTLEKVAAMRHGDLLDDWDYSNQTFCGIVPVLAAMRFAESKGCDKGHVLHYRNSGDDHPESRGSWVVGYGSVVFAASP